MHSARRYAVPVRGEGAGGSPCPGVSAEKISAMEPYTEKQQAWLDAIAAGRELPDMTVEETRLILGRFAFGGLEVPPDVWAKFTAPGGIATNFLALGMRVVFAQYQ